MSFEQDGELVAAQPGDGVAGAQARLEPPRDRDQQLVADQVAEAVVDDLEAVEVEEEDGEAACSGCRRARAMRLAQAVHEQRAVGQAGERVVEARAWRSCSSARLRSVMSVCEPAMRVAVPSRVAHRHAAAEHPAVRAVLVPDAVLVLEMARVWPCTWASSSACSRSEVVGMDAREPFAAGSPIVGVAREPSISFQRGEK